MTAEKHPAGVRPIGLERGLEGSSNGHELVGAGAGMREEGAGGEASLHAGAAARSPSSPSEGTWLY